MHPFFFHLDFHMALIHLLMALEMDLIPYFSSHLLINLKPEYLAFQALENHLNVLLLKEFQHLIYLPFFQIYHNKFLTHRMLLYIFYYLILYLILSFFIFYYFFIGYLFYNFSIVSII